MNETINELLEDAIEDGLLKLKMEIDPKKREELIRNIQELSSIQNGRIDISNKSNETAFKDEEIEFKRKCIRSEKILDGFKIGVDIMGIILPLAFYWEWMNAGLTFEKTGNFVSPTLKGLISKFKPTR